MPQKTTAHLVQDKGRGYQHTRQDHSIIGGDITATMPGHADYIARHCLARRVFTTGIG